MMEPIAIQMIWDGARMKMFTPVLFGLGILIIDILLDLIGLPG